MSAHCGARWGMHLLYTCSRTKVLAYADPRIIALS